MNGNSHDLGTALWHSAPPSCSDISTPGQQRPFCWSHWLSTPRVSSPQIRGCPLSVLNLYEHFPWVLFPLLQEEKTFELKEKARTFLKHVTLSLSSLPLWDWEGGASVLSKPSWEDIASQIWHFSILKCEPGILKALCFHLSSNSL